jgi:hypothetical protein
MKALKHKPFREVRELRRMTREFVPPLRRETLIQHGILIPGGFRRGEPKPDGWPMRACDGPVLRLDAAGKGAAIRHMREGNFGAIEMPRPGGWR